jgi:hypothetical protein
MPYSFMPPHCDEEESELPRSPYIAVVGEQNAIVTSVVEQMQALFIAQRAILGDEAG